MILSKFFMFFKYVLHPKPWWSTFQWSLQRDLLFLRLLKSSSKRTSSSKETSILFCTSLLFVFFFELWTSTNYLFLQWKLFNFSTWNKKSGPNVISSYFTLIHNGNQTLHNRNTKTIKCYYKYNFWPFLLNAVVNGIYKTIVLGRQQYCQHIGHPKYQSKLWRFSWGKKNIYKFR